MRSQRVTVVFAPELHGRLRWFSGLRWIAVAGLASASLAGRQLGFEGFWPSLLVVAGFVAAYNLFFIARLRRDIERVYEDLRASALRQISMDLVALIVTAYFTGGMRSPVLFFFAFHMAIGTIMMSAIWMYMVAGVASLGVIGLYAAEHSSLIPALGVEAEPHSRVVCAINALATVVAMFGIVYLTATVTDRFKRHSLKLRDLSEELQARNAEQRRLLNAIEDLEQRKSHYMRISAHQLRSPLGTIKTSLQVLEDGIVDPGSERGARLIAGASERADGLLHTVNDLLELAKMREGRGKAPWTQRIVLNNVLGEVLDSLTPQAEARNIEIVTDIEGVATLSWAIPPDLVYAFENIIHNAIKYSRDQSRVTVRLRVSSDEAVVDVIDEGIGIPREQLEEVFLEFVRAPNAKRHADEGTGLGLAIAREAIISHGGSVSVASAPGEGSTFRVELPLHYEPPEVTGRLQGE